MSHLFTIQDKRMMRYHFKSHNGGIDFSRLFFKERDGRKFIVNAHHKIVSDTLQRVLDGEIKRLIINMPPGYTKTEEAVINFISRGLAINPASLFMHLSYADDLALWNSTLARDIVSSDLYQEIFPMKIRPDISSKKKWYTSAGGGVYATASGGPVTGFRAGRLEANRFSGAMIIDDPIKPQDAYSDAKRELINDRFNSTFKSRLAKEDTTPIILMMQRVHEEDPSGFLLKGGTGEKWHHLILPGMMPKGSVLDWYPKEFTHGIPIEYDLPEGPLWTFKHTREDFELMEKTSPYTYASQYQQMPAPKGGSIWKDEYWKYYKALPLDIKVKRIYCDTAQKTKEHNDYTVFQCWGFSPTKGIFLIDQVRGKWESPELKRQLISFYNKHKFHHVKNPIGVTRVLVEDKSSGSGLIQTIKKETNIPIHGVQRNTDKVMRSFDTVEQVSAGNVWLPSEADWLFDYQNEFRKFTPLMTHKNDDQIDPTIDAIQDLLIDGPFTYEGIV